MKVRGTQFPVFAFKLRRNGWPYIDLIDRGKKSYFVILIRLAFGYSDAGNSYKPSGSRAYPISRSTFTKYKDMNTDVHINVMKYTIRSIFNLDSEKRIKDSK